MGGADNICGECAKFCICRTVGEPGFSANWGAHICPDISANACAHGSADFCAYGSTEFCAHGSADFCADGPAGADRGTDSDVMQGSGQVGKIVRRPAA